MGMAASQARFLNLTARKTNIEYQGQQINQQRTALANKSATLYNQMLTLQVPTPPNSADFTKVSYSFMMPGNVDEAQVSQFVKKTDGTYSVQFTYKTVELGMPPCTDEQKSRALSTATGYDVVTVQGKTYSLTEYVGDETATRLTAMNTAKTDYEADPTDPDLLEAYELATSAYETAASQQNIHADAVAKLKSDLGLAATDDVYFVNVGTQEAPKYQYYSEPELETATAAGSSTNAVTYYSASDIETYKEDSYSNCTLNRDIYNRVQSFTVTSTNTTFAVTTKTITDDEAYNDAMNEYTYKSYMYEQEMAEINATTSIIQIQDRELELKLKQLDTEHNAVQTEMETVKSVCKKNVEDSFKVFA